MVCLAMGKRNPTAEGTTVGTTKKGQPTKVRYTGMIAQKSNVVKAADGLGMRKLRAVLTKLLEYGVLISYELHMERGQTVLVVAEDGRPMRIHMRTACAYLRRLEELEWTG